MTKNEREQFRVGRCLEKGRRFAVLFRVLTIGCRWGRVVDQIPLGMPLE